MSLCDRREAHNNKPVDRVEHVWTPAEREAAQDAVLTHWLQLDAWHRQRLLAAERIRQGVAPLHEPPGVRAQVFTIDGVSRTIRQWATATGWSEDTVARRIASGDSITLHPSMERCVA